ncbi:MAG: SRPBCC domain-containing protein [Bdellovibrionota bacterium]
MLKKILVVFSALLIVAAGYVLVQLTDHRPVEYSETVAVARQPSEVFAYFVDPGKLKQWISSQIEISDLTGPLSQPGSRFKQTISNGQIHWEFAGEILEVEPNRKIVFKTESPGNFQMRETCELEERLGQVGISCKQTFQLSSLTAKFVQHRIQDRQRLQLKEDLARLQGLLGGPPR